MIGEGTKKKNRPYLMILYSTVLNGQKSAVFEKNLTIQDLLEKNPFQGGEREMHVV